MAILYTAKRRQRSVRVAAGLMIGAIAVIGMFLFLASPGTGSRIFPYLGARITVPAKEGEFGACYLGDGSCHEGVNWAACDSSSRAAQKNSCYTFEVGKGCITDQKVCTVCASVEGPGYIRRSSLEEAITRYKQECYGKLADKSEKDCPCPEREIRVPLGSAWYKYDEYKYTRVRGISWASDIFCSNAYVCVPDPSPSPSGYYK